MLMASTPGPNPIKILHRKFYGTLLFKAIWLATQNFQPIRMLKKLRSLKYSLKFICRTGSVRVWGCPIQIEVAVDNSEARTRCQHESDTTTPLKNLKWKLPTFWFGHLAGTALSRITNRFNYKNIAYSL